MSARAGIRTAMKAYVRGHDRIWVTGRKLGRHETADPSSVEFGHLPTPPSFGVSVPDRLAFDRGPGTSRSKRDGAGEG